MFDRVAGMKLMNKTQIKRHIVKERLYSIQVRSLAGETLAYIERDSEWVCIQLFPFLAFSQQSIEDKPGNRRSKIERQGATKVQHSMGKSD